MYDLGWPFVVLVIATGLLLIYVGFSGRKLPKKEYKNRLRKWLAIPGAVLVVYFFFISLPATHVWDGGVRPSYIREFPETTNTLEELRREARLNRIEIETLKREIFELRGETATLASHYNTVFLFLIVVLLNWFLEPVYDRLNNWRQESPEQ